MLSAAETSSNRAFQHLSRIRYARIPEVLPIPNLIELQLDSFRWFLDKGLRVIGYQNADRFLKTLSLLRAP